MSAARLRRRITLREAQAARSGRQPSAKVTEVMRTVAAIAAFVEACPPAQRPRILDAISEMKMRGPCWICGNPEVACVGLFFPSPELSARLLAPPGKYRRVLFGLCRVCQDLPDAMDRVGASIVSEADAMADRPERN